MDSNTYQAKGILVYNKVVAQGQSERGEWLRSEVVVECHTESGKTYCKVFTYWGALNIPVGASITLSWRMEEGKPYTDKNGNERKTFTPRIVEAEEVHENKELLFNDTMRETLDFKYHYDAKSGALFVPRVIKAYVDGTPYFHPDKDGSRFVKRGKTVLFEVVNRQRVRKLLSVMGDVTKLDSVTLMTYGEWLDEEQERCEQNYYICSPRLYNVSEYTMLAEECRGGAGGKYIVKAPRLIINEFIKWLLYDKGSCIDYKTNKQILASWREFIKSSIM